MARDRSAAISCTHCGLPVPRGLVREDAEEQFCCGACDLAYRTIHASGLDKYYELARAMRGDAERPAAGTGKAYAELDDPVFEELYVQHEDDGTCQTELVVDGMHCAACVWLLERAPNVIDGLVDARVNYGRSRLALRWNPEATPLSAVARQVDSLGYALRPARGSSGRESKRREHRRMLIRVGVAGALAGNVMLASVSLYAGAFSGMEEEFETMFRWLSMGLAMLSLFWPGSIFLQGAVTALRLRVPHTDVPVALGLLIGTGAGLYHTILGHGDLYADSLAMLIFLLLVGRWVQMVQQNSASNAVELFSGIAPSTAQLLRDDELVDVPVEALRIGDIVEVGIGAVVPADGAITSGRSSINASLLTGESRPEHVSEGDELDAGVLNLTSPLRMMVSRTGAETRIGRLLEMLERASETRAPFVRLADRIAGRFVVVVLVLATLTLLGWLLIEPSKAIDATTALLIVTCPCALALATPLCVAAAIGSASKRGMFIKGGDTLEALAHTQTIVLDKTGTITEGNSRVVHWEGDPDVKRLAAAVEQNHEHPVARAILDTFPQPPEAHEVDASPGKGVCGQVEGHTIIVGSAKYVLEHVEASEPLDWVSSSIGDALAQALTPVLVAVDGSVCAVAHVGDAIRPEAAAVIERLQRHGRSVMLLSGDRQEIAEAVSRAVGIDNARGEATPEDKAAIIDAMQRDAHVAMVGDGVNDALALGKATVGVAVHGGAEASLAAADVFLSRPGLVPLEHLMAGARRTFRGIRITLGFSLLYNVTCGSIAIAGFMSPLLAAVLMPCSSITVILLARFMRTFDGAQV
jgi:Cu2+-exporting ATPase